MYTTSAKSVSIFLLFVAIFYVSEGKDAVCQTSSCQNAASDIQKMMFPERKPCDYFYFYACASFRKSYPPSTNLWPTSTLSVRQNANIEELKGFLEKPNDVGEPQSIQKARKLYLMCLDTEKLDKMGLQSIKNFLIKVGLTADPPIGDHKDFDLTYTLVKIKQLIGINPFFKVSIVQDPFDKTKNRPLISSDMPEKYSLTASALKKLKNLLMVYAVDAKYVNELFQAICENSPTDVCSKLKDPETSPGVTFLYNRLNDYIAENFEVYAKGSSDLPELMTLAELQKFTDDIASAVNSSIPNAINWKRYFSLFFEGLENFSVNDDFKVLVRNREVLKEILTRIYKPIKPIPGTEMLEMFLWFDVVNTLDLLASSKLRNTKEKLINKFVAPFDRKHYCVTVVNHILARGMGYYYTKSPVYNRIKKEVTEFLKNVDFKEAINRAVWMDSKTKEKALQKLESLKIRVAYPDEYEDSQKEVEIDDDILETIAKANVQKHKIGLPYVNKVNDLSRERKEMFEPESMDIVVEQEANKIIIPAGILGLWKDDPALTSYNYGSLGSLIVSKILLIFGETGKHYGKTGAVENWWSNETSSEFEKVKQCYEASLKSNPKLFSQSSAQSNDEIAFVEAFKLALAAYRKQLPKEEQALPGLEDLTGEQLFTLGYTQMFCRTESILIIDFKRFSKENYKQTLIYQALTQTEEFSKIWKCDKGSAMYPIESRCSAW